MATSQQGVSGQVIYLLAAAIAGLGGTATYQAVKPPRPDPWTATEATKTHQQMQREWRLDLRELEQRIRDDMPPHLTRMRIIRLESAVTELMRQEGKEWSPHTQQWTFIEQ